MSRERDFTDISRGLVSTLSDPTKDKNGNLILVGAMPVP